MNAKWSAYTATCGSHHSVIASFLGFISQQKVKGKEPLFRSLSLTLLNDCTGAINFCTLGLFWLIFDLNLQSWIRYVNLWNYTCPFYAFCYGVCWQSLRRSLTLPQELCSHHNLGVATINCWPLNVMGVSQNRGCSEGDLKQCALIETWDL